MSNQAIDIEDLRRLALAGAPDLVQAILTFAEQPDDESGEQPAADDMNLAALREGLGQAQKTGDKRQRQEQARELWKRYLAQEKGKLAPQIDLADLVIWLYEQRTQTSRAALIKLAREAPLVWGLWGGLKRLYKRVEADMDVELFGALAARFDLARVRTPRRSRRRRRHVAVQNDVGTGTLIYMRRRAARFLRLLGRSNPELYPQFAIEVLRNYPPDTDKRVATIAKAIFQRRSDKWGGPNPPKNKKFRAAYLEAWKRSPDPLMVLLETCQADIAAAFAIQGLRELFPAVLRSATPEWLSRLAYRPLESAHEFLVDTLHGSTEFHQSKLQSLGLAEAVFALVLSPCTKARKYAIEYARGRSDELSVERLVEWLAQSVHSDTNKFVVQVLTGRKPRDLGVPMLGRLLMHSASRKWAESALENNFDRNEIGEDFLVEMLVSADDDQCSWVQKHIKKKYKPTELTAAFWMRVLDHPALQDEDDYREGGDFAIEQLKKGPLSALPGDWVLNAINRDDIGWSMSRWLSEADSLPQGLDLERVKGLVFDPRKRSVAFAILGNPKLVPPGSVGLAWLLALAKRADPQMHDWAHRYLLQHMSPMHFADGDVEGVDRLFALATGTREPEAVRAFAQTYLRCHHPKLGRHLPETKEYGIKSAIPLAAYTLERVWPSLWDTRADVRRFAVTIARAELRRWKAHTRVYELAESTVKEIRNLAFDALLQAGDSQADENIALKPDELDPAQIFSMTESRRRQSREVAMELIRKHYARLGGAERLAWLMQSADREVRLFAVRLLWEKHRPRGLPSQWKPARGSVENAGPFEDAEALRGLLRRMLFSIPPTRSLEQMDRKRAHKLPASVAKRHVVEMVRDMGMQDVAFAQLVAPVLGEFTGSIAKGEWEACLSALMTLRARHGFSAEEMV